MTVNNETTIVITGASSGIGKALAEKLAAKGAKLGLIARREEALSEVERGARERGAADVVAVPCDVTDADAVTTALQRFEDELDEIDVLINNAGSGHFGYIEGTPLGHVRSVFDVNVFALWNSCRVVLPHMRRRGHGHIINIASMAGKIGYPGNAAYVAAKHAVVGFTRALRAETAGIGVEASVVIPGGVKTEWATKTKGGPMLDIFEYERVKGAELAAEDGIDLYPALPLLEPDEVALFICDLIEHPRPELYTHEGSLELVRDYEMDQLETEKRLEPLWVANRQGYDKLMRDEELSVDSEK